MEDFVGIGGTTARALPTGCTLSGQDLEVLRAIAVYAAYRSFNHVRHSTEQAEAFADVFRGFVREATRGHASSAAVVAAIWRRADA